MGNNYYYKVLDSEGNYLRAFKKFADAQTFWISRGGAMSGWRIIECKSKY